MYTNHKFLLIYFLCVFISTSVYSQYDSLLSNDLWRTYLTHLPTQYDVTENIDYPLIIAMHGGFGNAYNLEIQSQLSTKADTAEIPFIVVYPEGVKSPLGIASWNAGECCGYASNKCE